MPDPEPPTSLDIETGRTVILTGKDVRDAARLFRLISDGMRGAKLPVFEQEAVPSSSAPAFPRDELLSRAGTILNARRLRARHFHRAIFGEPAWDVLLLLYLADSLEGRQTIGKLAELVETPLTTLLRWVAYLEKEHLVERRNHPTDRRIVFLVLSDKGRHAMEAYLGEMRG